MNKSILLVFAHPDDESFGAAGTAAKYARRGIPVDLVCATRGENGTRLDVPDDLSTSEAREAELRTAAAIIGIRDVSFLDYIDGELGEANAEEVAGKVLEMMSKLQPEAVITFGPDGITGHPDHIAISQATTLAFEALWQQDNIARRLYYVTIPRSYVPNADEIGIATRPDEQVTATIDISDYLDVKIRAIEAHRSQQDAREFVEMLKQNRQAGYAAREFFFLARPRASRKETDLYQE